jgi:AcrR family transcriptional regulator
MQGRGTRGRHQSEDVEERVLAAVVEMLGQGGYCRLTIDEVARESQVAKTTIYRRWANKVDLVIDAIDRISAAPELVNTGSLEADLEDSIGAALRIFRGPHGRAKISIYAESLHNPELAEAWSNKVRKPHEDALRAVLQRGMRSGRFHSSTYLDETTAMLAGLSLYYALINREPLRSGFAARAAMTVLDGLDNEPRSDSKESESLCEPR